MCFKFNPSNPCCGNKGFCPCSKKPVDSIYARHILTGQVYGPFTKEEAPPDATGNGVSPKQWRVVVPVINPMAAMDGYTRAVGLWTNENVDSGLGIIGPVYGLSGQWDFWLACRRNNSYEYQSGYPDKKHFSFPYKSYAITKVNELPDYSNDPPQYSSGPTPIPIVLALFQHINMPGQSCPMAAFKYDVSNSYTMSSSYTSKLNQSDKAPNYLYAPEFPLTNKITAADIEFSDESPITLTLSENLHFGGKYWNGTANVNLPDYILPDSYSLIGRMLPFDSNFYYDTETSSGPRTLKGTFVGYSETTGLGPYGTGHLTILCEISFWDNVPDEYVVNGIGLTPYIFEYTTGAYINLAFMFTDKITPAGYVGGVVAPVPTTGILYPGYYGYPTVSVDNIGVDSITYNVDYEVGATLTNFIVVDGPETYPLNIKVKLG